MRLSNQKVINRLIRVKKHELNQVVKEYVDARKKQETGKTISKLVTWYKQFRPFLFTLDQREITLNNAGIGRVYVDYMLNQGKSNSVIGQWVGIFVATLNRLDIMHQINKKELMRNFAKSDKSNEDFFMTAEEVKQLLNLLVEDPIERIALDRFLVACFTGCRRSEVLSVQVENENTLRYTQIKTKKDVLVPLAKPIKHLFIDEEWKEDIGHWDEHINEILHRIFKRLEWNRPVKKFNLHGKKKSVYEIPRWKALTFHSARKYYGKMLLDMDISIYKVSQLLGHSQVITTQNFYAAITKGKMINEVNDKLNQF